MNLSSSSIWKKEVVFAAADAGITLWWDTRKITLETWDWFSRIMQHYFFESDWWFPNLEIDISGDESKYRILDRNKNWEPLAPITWKFYAFLHLLVSDSNLRNAKKRCSNTEELQKLEIELQEIEDKLNRNTWEVVNEMESIGFTLRDWKHKFQIAFQEWEYREWISHWFNITRINNPVKSNSKILIAKPTDTNHPCITFVGTKGKYKIFLSCSPSDTVGKLIHRFLIVMSNDGDVKYFELPEGSYDYLGMEVFWGNFFSHNDWILALETKQEMVWETWAVWALKKTRNIIPLIDVEWNLWEDFKDYFSEKE